jgi:large subunit ribosomal protein L31
MKENIHPKYNKEVIATCACGAKFATGSTREEIKVEVCSACHPFFTGKQKLVDTAGRVDKFKAKMEASRKMQEANAKKASEKPAKKESKEEK